MASSSTVPRCGSTSSTRTPASPGTLPLAVAVLVVEDVAVTVPVRRVNRHSSVRRLIGAPAWLKSAMTLTSRPPPPGDGSASSTPLPPHM